MIFVKENKIIKPSSEDKSNATRKIDFLKIQREAKRSTEAAFGVLKITVVRLLTKTSKNTSCFTNYFTSNFQLIRIKYGIFSNEGPGINYKITN